MGLFSDIPRRMSLDYWWPRRLPMVLLPIGVGRVRREPSVDARDIEHVHHEIEQHQARNGPELPPSQVEEGGKYEWENDCEKPDGYL